MDHPLLSVQTPWPEHESPAWKITTYWAAVEGRLACVRAELASLTADEGGALVPITASDWRAVPFGQILERAQHDAESLLKGVALLDEERIEQLEQIATSETTRAYFQLLKDLTPAMRAQIERVANELQIAPAASERRVSDKVASAARIYQDAWSKRRPKPTRAVAEALSVSPTAAAKLVARARDAGLLPKAAGRGQATGVQKESGA